MSAKLLAEKLEDVRTMLRRMGKYRGLIGEEYPARAYENAAKALTSPDKLGRVLDGMDMPKGIGKKIREVIIEYISSGSVAELSELRTDPKIIALERFEKVMGVGPVNALKFVEQGYTTLSDLRDDPYLTKQQKIGIEYYGKIMLRIPRQIITVAFDKISGIINALDPGSNAIVSGSYRRGSATSGDVDILVCSDTLTGATIMTTIEERYAHTPDKIVTISSGQQKVMFLFEVPVDESMKYIQVDIFVSKSDEYIAHLNYSTGSADHNIMLRNAAIKKGLKLSQHGLYRGDKKIKLSSERELYELLDVPFVEPHERNV